MNSCHIDIARDDSLYGCALKHTVEIDGFYIGTLKNGCAISATVTAGYHTISFIRHSKVEKTVTVLIKDGTHTAFIRVKLNKWQKLEVSDNTCTDQPSDVPTYGRPFYPGNKYPIFIMLGFIVAIFLSVGLLKFGFYDKVPQPEPSVTPQTDKEKAEVQLERATLAFRDGDYISAIEICADISATYPDTETAASMDEYLSSHYEQFSYFTAEELQGEYDANIVNADKQYTDTVMIVSGTVTDIGKTNGGSNLTLLLDSGAYFYGIQLNLSTKQTDAVAELEKGDTVTAIGKCTGKSGKQLFVFDGNNVMIENCYLITYSALETSAPVA